MPRCTGECKKQEFETSDKWAHIGTVPHPDNPADRCPKTLDKTRLKEIAKSLKDELEADEILVACERDDCGCSYQEAEWGEELEGEAAREVTIGECRYTVRFKYLIRSRIRHGACVSVRYTSAAMGVVPESGLVLIAKTRTEAFEPDVLEKLKDLTN